MKKNIILLLLTFIFISLFKNYEIINSNIIKICTIFIKNIFPSVFPILLISSLILNLNIYKPIIKPLVKINKKIFNITESQTFIFFMSLFSGFPSSAKTSKEMYDKKLISRKEIQKIILFTHFANPIFILNIVQYHKYLVLTTHFISNIIIALILKNFYKNNTKVIKKQDKIINKNISVILFESITNSINTCMFILGTLITFNILSSIINIPIFNIILELSNGINYINILELSIKFKTILIGSLISFGGLCIHLQVYGILNDINIKYYPYLLTRILQAIITAILIFIFYK
jgi:hypothetical protein